MLLLKDAIAFGRDEPIDLLHRTRCRPLVLGPTQDGRIPLCGLTPRPSIALLSAPDTISSVYDTHPSMPLLAAIERGSWKLLLLRFDGSIAFEIPAPPLREGSPEWMRGGYDHCLFDESGRYLWCAASVSKDQIEVQLRETDGWSVVSRTLVDDPFGANSAGASSALLLPTAEPGTLSLWLAEGQGGACVYWVTRHGVRVRCSPEPSLCDTTPPEFSPGGREFLVIDLYGAVRRFSYPVVEQLGVCESPFGDDEPFHLSLCYLDDARALAVSLNGRIAVLDTPTMRVVNELTIEGHEPRPAEEHYPNLAGDRNLCTDISEVTRLGDYLIFGHAAAPALGLAPRRNLNVEDQDDGDTKGMLCFAMSYVLDRYAG